MDVQMRVMFPSLLRQPDLVPSRLLISLHPSFLNPHRVCSSVFVVVGPAGIFPHGLKDSDRVLKVCQSKSGSTTASDRDKAFLHSDHGIVASFLSRLLSDSFCADQTRSDRDSFHKKKMKKHTYEQPEILVQMGSDFLFATSSLANRPSPMPIAIWAFHRVCIRESIKEEIVASIEIVS